MKRILAGFLGVASSLAWLACSGPERSTKPDVRPRMNAVRADAAQIAALIAHDRPLDAIAPAERLARLDLGDKTQVPADLAVALDQFRTRAEKLVVHLKARDVAASNAAFRDVVSSCTACHHDHRPATSKPITIEFE